jgi:hypothetical protein
MISKPCATAEAAPSIIHYIWRAIPSEALSLDIALELISPSSHADPFHATAKVVAVIKIVFLMNELIIMLILGELIVSTLSWDVAILLYCLLFFLSLQYVLLIHELLVSLKLIVSLARTLLTRLFVSIRMQSQC